MTSLTRREFAQTLLATTAVAALVPVWSSPGDILDPGFQRAFTDPDTWVMVENPNDWFMIGPRGRYVFEPLIRLEIA